MNSREEHEEDQFSRLPDDLVRRIFSKLLDARSLSLCCAVCKRFSSLVHQTDAVSVTLGGRASCNGHDSSRLCRGVSVNFLKILVSKLIAKPLGYLHRIAVPKSATTNSGCGDSYHSLDTVLKKFTKIKSLHVELPSHGGEFGSDGGSLLKWNAEFGSELENCAILGAASFQKAKLKSRKSCEEERVQLEELEPRCSDDELKLRVVWTISCLIAASARHYLIRRMIVDRPMLRSVVITDSNRQGRLRMGEEQIGMMRSSANSPVTLESPMGRTRVPELRMKLWYVPLLELPGTGWVMRGATLVVIRAVDGPVRVRSDGEMLAGAFDGEERENAFREAVREMLKRKKTYIMEMNSF